MLYSRRNHRQGDARHRSEPKFVIRAVDVPYNEGAPPSPPPLPPSRRTTEIPPPFPPSVEEDTDEMILSQLGAAKTRGRGGRKSRVRSSHRQQQKHCRDRWGDHNKSNNSAKIEGDNNKNNNNNNNKSNATDHDDDEELLFVSSPSPLTPTVLRKAADFDLLDLSLRRELRGSPSMRLLPDLPRLSDVVPRDRYNGDDQVISTPFSERLSVYLTGALLVPGAARSRTMGKFLSPLASDTQPRGDDLDGDVNGRDVRSGGEGGGGSNHALHPGAELREGGRG